MCVNLLFASFSRINLQVDIRLGESFSSNGHEFLQELVVFLSAGSGLTKTEIQLVIEQGFILQLSAGVLPVA